MLPCHPVGTMSNPLATRSAWLSHNVHLCQVLLAAAPAELWLVGLHVLGLDTSLAPSFDLTMQQNVRHYSLAVQQLLLRGLTQAETQAPSLMVRGACGVVCTCGRVVRTHNPQEVLQ